VRSMKAVDLLTDEKLREITSNVNGIQPSLFTSHRSFGQLVKMQVGRLDAPGHQCVEFAHNELHDITTTVANRLFERFPQLRDHVIRIADNVLVEYRKACARHVKTMVESEQAYINVRHPAMLAATSPGTLPPPPPTPVQAGAAASQPAVTTSPRVSFEVPRVMLLSGPLTDKETFEFHQLRCLVETYFGIVKETVVDQVPKVVVNLMINKLMRELHPTLTSQLYKPELFDQLLEEAPAVVKQRHQLSHFMAALQRAKTILNRVGEPAVALIGLAG